MVTTLHIVDGPIEGRLGHFQPGVFCGAQGDDLQHRHGNVRIAGDGPIAPAPFLTLRSNDQFDDPLEFRPHGRRAGRAIEFGQRDGGDAMAIHVLAVVAITHQAVGRGIVEQVLQAGGDILPELPFPRQLAGGLKRQQDISRDGDGMLLLFRR